MTPSNYPTNLNQVPSPTTLLGMIRSYQISQCVYIVAKLKIADLLKDGEQHSDTLAIATNTNKDAIYRLLRTLASFGIFAETQAHYFCLTPLATYLQSNVPNSLNAYAIMSGEEHYQTWGNLMFSIQTGENAFENLYDMNIYEFLQQNPVPAKTFDQAMTEFSGIVNPSILSSYNFSSIGKLVDVGGGNGRLLSSILQAYPDMTGVLFDRPNVIDRASDFLASMGVNNRLQLAKGDFFKAIPTGGDAYMMKHIIHNWGDEEAIAILQNCYQTMGEQAILLIIEIVMPPGNDPFMGKFIDMNMLIMTPGGRVRSETEYRKLLKTTGFKLTKIVPTESELSIIEAVKD